MRYCSFIVISFMFVMASCVSSSKNQKMIGFDSQMKASTTRKAARKPANEETAQLFVEGLSPSPIEVSYPQKFDLRVSYWASDDSPVQVSAKPDPNDHCIGVIDKIGNAANPSYLMNISDSSTTGGFFDTHGKNYGSGIGNGKIPIEDFELREEHRVSTFDYKHSTSARYPWMSDNYERDFDALKANNVQFQRYSRSEGLYEQVVSIGRDYYVRRKVWIDSNMTSISRMTLELIQGPPNKGFDKMAVKTRMNCDPPQIAQNI